jgi:hypothetical protein
MTAVSGKGGNGGIGGHYGEESTGSGGSGASRFKAIGTFIVSTQATITVIVGEDGKNGSQGTLRQGAGKDMSTYLTGGVGGSATIGNGQAGQHGEPLTEAKYGKRPGGGGGSGGGASGVVDKVHIRGGGGGGGGGAPIWNGRGYSTGNSGTNGNGSTGGNGAVAARGTGAGAETGAGGNGGNGGSLTGSALTGTTTTESPYVKIELA